MYFCIGVWPCNCDQYIFWHSCLHLLCRGGQLSALRNSTNKKAVHVIGTASTFNNDKTNADPRRGVISPLAWPWSHLHLRQVPVLSPLGKQVVKSFRQVYYVLRTVARILVDSLKAFLANGKPSSKI